MFIPIWRFDGYYPIAEVSIRVRIPELVEKPIKGWPPGEMIRKGDIVSNPWEWSNIAVDINKNYTKMLATEESFIFNGVEFGTAGKHITTRYNSN